MNFNELTIQLTPRTLLFGCAGLGTLALITFIFATWQWRSDWILAHHEINTPVVVKADNTNELLASIPASHIFGKALDQMPVTNLQMRVTGIVKTSDQSQPSKAYISIEGQPGKIYQEGDDLPNGVKINSISADSVILDIDGRLEKLPLPREKLEFKPRQQETF